MWLLCYGSAMAAPCKLPISMFSGSAGVIHQNSHNSDGRAEQTEAELAHEEL